MIVNYSPYISAKKSSPESIKNQDFTPRLTTIHYLGLHHWTFFLGDTLYQQVYYSREP